MFLDIWLLITISACCEDHPYIDVFRADDLLYNRMKLSCRARSIHTGIIGYTFRGWYYEELGLIFYLSRGSLHVLHVTY